MKSIFLIIIKITVSWRHAPDEKLRSRAMLTLKSLFYREKVFSRLTGGRRLTDATKGGLEKNKGNGETLREAFSTKRLCVET